MSLSMSGGRLFTALVLALSGLFAAFPSVAAESFPSRPIRFIVPFPPGGTVDPLARLIGAKLTANLGQQVIVDNRTGGSGVIGTSIAAKANPDGYTYVFVFDTHGVNPSLVPKMPFDTLKDLAPVMLVGRAPYALVTHPKKPFHSLGDVIRAAKSRPDTLTYGTVGAGSIGHLALVLAEQAGGFKLVHVPYKGGGPMTAAVLGGQIDIGIGSSALMTPLVNDKRVRALAVTGDTRAKTLPDVPTFQELGYKGVSAYAWWGILTPAGIPPAVLTKIHGEITKAVNAPDVREHLADRIGMELIVSSPEALGEWTRTEIQRWAKLIKANNIKP
jgi:tripartite-type tricarboxylate transporter receptor subunit TctC